MKKIAALALSLTACSASHGIQRKAVVERYIVVDTAGQYCTVDKGVFDSTKAGDRLNCYWSSTQ